MTSTSEFQNANEIFDREVEYYSDFILETHLADVKERNDYSAYDIADKNVCRAIYLSYETFGNDQYTNFVLNDKITQYGIGDSQNDNLAYFYLNYVPNHSELNIIDILKYDTSNPTVKPVISFDDKTPTQYLVDLYKSDIGFGSTYSLLFAETDGMPVLNTQAAYFIYQYILDKSNDTGLEYYQTYQDAYVRMLEWAEVSVYQSEPYYTEHYVPYQNSAITIARSINVTMLICILLGSFIGVMLPKFLFKDETTIGRKLSGLGVITIDNERVPKWVYVVKSIITSIFYFSVALITYAFFYGFSVLSFPSYPDTPISFGLIILILVIIAAINGIVGLFTHYKQTLLDVVFRTKVVDLKFLDEGDLDEPDEAKPY